jgi:hypothetical protein
MICRIDNSQATEAEDEDEDKDEDKTETKTDLFQGLTNPEWQCVHFWSYKPQQTDDVIHTCKVPEKRYAAAMDLIISDYRNMGGDSNSSAGIWVENHCHAEPAIPHNKWVCKEEGLLRQWR